MPVTGFQSLTALGSVHELNTVAPHEAWGHITAITPAIPQEIEEE